MRNPLYSWVLRNLDSLLTERQRQARPDDLSRYRVILATAGLLTPLTVLYLAGTLAQPLSSQLNLAAGSLVGYMSTLALLRWSRSLWAPSLMLCLTMASSYIAGGILAGKGTAGAHVASTLIPLLAFFLMGARGGLAFALLMALNAVLIQPLSGAGFDFSSPRFTNSMVLSGNLFAAACILGVWGLSYLHSRARDDAQAALERTLRNLHEGERKLSSVVESTEIATGVLHNVGNTLNSVNVSASLVAERLRGSRLVGLIRAAELLQAHSDNLHTFLTQDEKGQVLPEYLLSVSRQLAKEHERMLTEVQALTKNVEHIKSVVSMQQEHARFAGRVEQVILSELIDDALRLHATSFERLGIHVRRDYRPVPPVLVDRHRLLQILVNLLSNARHALLESGRHDKQLTLSISAQPGERLRILVADNGVGISPENLSRVFTRGFTTKRNGHGFGLHASALAAEELRGSLTCTSEGLHQGATFIIDLPLTREHSPV